MRTAECLQFGVEIGIGSMYVFGFGVIVSFLFLVCTFRLLCALLVWCDHWCVFWWGFQVGECSQIGLGFVSMSPRALSLIKCAEMLAGKYALKEHSPYEIPLPIAKYKFFAADAYRAPAFKGGIYIWGQNARCDFSAGKAVSRRRQRRIKRGAKSTGAILGRQ